MSSHHVRSSASRSMEHPAPSSSKHAGSRRDDGGQAGSSSSSSSAAVSEHVSVARPELHDDEGGWRQRARRSGGGFLLSHALPQRRDGGGGGGGSSGSGDGGGRPAPLPANGNGTHKAPSSRLSVESSVRSSPLSREMRFSTDEDACSARGGLDGARPDTGYSNSASSQSPSQSQLSMDSSQLVQMALSLSEGRRRHVSASLTVPSATPDKRRVRSAGGPAVQVVPGSPLANDLLRRPASISASLVPHPQHLDGRALSALGRTSHDHHHHNNNNQENDGSAGPDHAMRDEEHVDFHFSAATINRAERAKKLFGLASEYRRLLTHLPPLKPDSKAPGNYTFTTSSAPGIAQPQINRVRSNTTSKHELGREYNPLQLLRNRRVRHREQRPLDPPVEAFDRVDKVRTYIDEVEQESRRATYRGAVDVVGLPTFGHGGVSEDAPPAQANRVHRRTDTSTSKSFRPIGDWSFAPSELFADALWLEQSDNKSLIENRHGHKVFPSSARMDRDRASLESLRTSRKSKESLRPDLERTPTHESAVGTADESTATATAAKRGRKKRKLLSLRHVDNAARKHIFRQQRDVSDSSSDESSAGLRKSPLLAHGNQFSEENLGPLDRHMRTLIERERSSLSPELDSPDKWDRAADQQQQQQQQQRKASIPDNVSFNGNEEAHLAKPSNLRHTRNTSSKTDANISPDDRGRPSLDESTAPNSPSVASFIPRFGMSLSPPPSRHSSPERKFGVFGNSSKETNKIQETDFATSLVDLAPHGKDNVDETPPARSSLDSARPAMLKRHKTTNSISSDRPSSYDRRGSKDTGAMSRFFKGGRIGDLVRSEGSAFGDVIWKKKPPRDTNAASDSSADEAATADEDDDDDDDDDHHLKKRPVDVSRTSSNSGAGKSRYHTPGLPMFRSQKDVEGGDQELGDDQRVTHDKSQGLVAPRIQLPDDSGDEHSEPHKVNPISPIAEERRGSDSLLSPMPKNRSTSSIESEAFDLGLPGSISRRPNKGPMTPLANVTASSSRRPSLKSKRQWSISDARLVAEAQVEQQPKVQRVSLQDLGRVRALYLTSGVKAHEIIRRANQTVTPPSEFLVSAGKMCKEKITPAPAMEEFLIAARLYSGAISSGTDGLRGELERFRTSRVPALHTMFEQLRDTVDEKLMPVIQSTADEADAFTVEITTHQTLAVKQVNDAVDAILRSRRRRLRLLQKMGFAVLEWLVLGLLWIVWFVVIIIRFFRGIVTGVVRGTRWCLWL